MQRTARATVNFINLRHNLSIARKFAGPSKIMCVIKANAYGHGMLPVADVLHEADGFAVACVDEALLLRQHGITQPITVFQGFSDKRELQLCIEQQFWPVVHHESQCQMLKKQLVNHSKKLTLWMKISSGMNRLGFNASEIKKQWQALQQLPVIEEIKLMTHMACADEGYADDGFTSQQIQNFTKATAGLTAERSLANSAAMIAWPHARQDWVRPGIMLYGGAPFLPQRGPVLDLKPVMTLSSTIIAINTRQQGESIGYGCVWQCPKTMKIAVVAIGYGDGYPRGIAENTPVLINGRRALIVGRVSMDLLTVDLQGIDAKIGDEVILWGDGLPVDEIAEKANTISYELLCNVSNRVQHIY